MNKQDIIDEHFILTVHDLVNGTSINEIETIIKLYEEIEEYEICAGMYAALKIFKQVYDGYK